MAGYLADSSSNCWNTPERERRYIRAFMPEIDLDPASNSTSGLFSRVKFCLPEQDGLRDSWVVADGHENIFVNPPWGRQWRKKGTSEYIDVIQRKILKASQPELLKLYEPANIDCWVERAASHNRSCPESAILMLVPADMGNAYWQDIVLPDAAAICYPRGRISFELTKPDGTIIKGPATKSCAYVLFTQSLSRVEDFSRVFWERGVITR